MCRIMSDLFANFIKNLIVCELLNKCYEKTLLTYIILSSCLELIILLRFNLIPQKSRAFEIQSIRSIKPFSKINYFHTFLHSRADRF